MNNQYFNQVYSLYYKDLYRFIFSYLRNEDKTLDIIQETFIKFYEKDLKNDRNIKCWLFSVSKNLSLNLMRKEKREAEYVSTLKDYASDNDDSYVDLYDALDKIPSKYSEAIRLFYFANMSAKEIGKSIFVSEDAAKKRLQRGTEKQKSVLFHFLQQLA